MPDTQDLLTSLRSFTQVGLNDVVDTPVAPTVVPGYSKYQVFLNESAKRKKELEAHKLQAANELIKEKHEEQNSFASQLGLDPNGFAHSAVNMATYGRNAATQAFTTATNLPGLLGHASRTNRATDEEKALYGKFKSGDITDQEMFKLHAEDARGSSVYERLSYEDEVLDNASERVKATEDNFAKVDPTQRNLMNDALERESRESREAFEKSPGIRSLVDLVIDAGDVATSNPKALMEYIAEMTPELVAGATTGPVGLTATSLAYSMDQYRSSVQEVEGKLGRPMTAGELEETLFWSLSAGAADLAGNVALLRPLGFLKGTDTAKKVIADISKKSDELKNTASHVPGVRAAAAITGNSVTEGGTEMFQTFAENQASHNETTTLDLFKAGTIGMGASGLITGPSHIAKDIATSKPAEKAAAVAAEAFTEQANNTTIDKVAEDGKFVDLYKSGTSPAVLIQGLQKYQDKEGLSTEEVAKTKEGIKNLTNILENTVTAAEKEVSLFTEEGNTAARNEVADLKTEVEELKQAEVPDAESISSLESRIENTENYLDRVDGLDEQGKIDAQKVVADKLEKAKADMSLVTRNAEVSARIADAKTESTSTEDLLKSVKDTEVDEATTDTVVEEIAIRAMRDPDSLSNVSFEKVLAEANNLSEKSKENLKIIESAQLAYQKGQTLSSTQNDILHAGQYAGGKGTYKFSGLADYRNAINNSLRNGNTSRANNALKEMSRFALNQTNKHAALKQAKEMALTGEGQVYVVPKGDNQWEATQKLPSHIKNSVNGRKSAGVWTLRAGNTKQLTALDNVIALTGQAASELNTTAATAKVAIEAKGKRGNSDADIQALTKKKNKEASKAATEVVNIHKDDDLSNKSDEDLEAELDSVKSPEETEVETPDDKKAPTEKPVKKTTSSHLYPVTGQGTIPEAKENSLPAEARELLIYLPTKNGNELFKSVAQAEQVGNAWRRDGKIEPFQVVKDGDGFALFVAPKELGSIEVQEVVTDAKGNNKQVTKAADVSWRQRKKRNKVLQELLACVS